MEFRIFLLTQVFQEGTETVEAHQGDEPAAEAKEPSLDAVLIVLVAEDLLGLAEVGMEHQDRVSGIGLVGPDLPPALLSHHSHLHK